MAKYSTGGSAGGGSGGACELCGKSADSLQTASVAGAELSVCPSCAASHDESESKTETGGNDEQERKRRAAQNTAKAIDAGSTDSEHWEEHGTNYDSDQLPYLVADYGERVVKARQEAGLQRDELAEEIDVDENDLLAVEQGRANQADVGGSVIRALEQHLDVTLADK